MYNFVGNMSHVKKYSFNMPVIHFFKNKVVQAGTLSPIIYELLSMIHLLEEDEEETMYSGNKNASLSNLAVLTCKTRNASLLDHLLHCKKTTK